MFQQQASTPWYNSTAILVAASIVLPPVGLALLWLRRDTLRTKLVGTLCILIIAIGYVFTFNVWRRSRSANEAHYAELEQHRHQQAAQATANNVAAVPVSASPTASVAVAGQQPSPGSPDAAAQSASSHATRNYWTSFRGPKRDGQYDEMSILTSWPSNGLPLVWKQPVGVGYSSFSVADGTAYTIEQRRRQEVAVAYDVASGKEIWTQAWNAEYTDDTGDGPRTTPTWDQGRIYALGATGELRCLDAKTGAVIWGRNILSENQAQNLPWAMAASPLVVDDKVIVLPGGTGGKSVVAYNKMTGAPVWKVLNDTQAYVSPMLVELAGRRQIMVVSSSRVVGLVPEDGSVLWSYPWNTDNGINVSQPLIVDKNRFFISSGYGKGAALVQLSGSGKTLTPSTVWENNFMKNKFNSSVLHNGYVYGLDEGILTCLDVNTGERKWKGGRYGYGQVILASGHLVVISDNGDLALVKASPDQYTEVSRFAALKGKTWNYPAIAAGRILVRNSNEMAAYNIASN
jgi:outer membrane protein assembly factor BamB